MNEEKSIWKSLGYLVLIILLLLVGGVLLGVVYPWFGQRFAGSERREVIDERVLEHGHSHDDYDHTHDEKVFLEFEDFNKRFEKVGYEIVFFNPRYVDNLGVRLFEMDVRLVNNEFEPYAGPAMVCDVSEADRVSVNGKGVQLSKLEDVYPGESAEWEVSVRYDEGDDWWVSACRYTPTGSFEESKTVEVELPKP